MDDQAENGGLGTLGRLRGIYTAPGAGEPMEARDAVRAVPGEGLEGDRYARGDGTWSKPGLWSQVTLVRSEDLEAASLELGQEIPPWATRRNLVVEGLGNLESLMGARFYVGEVELEGVRGCSPCGHLEDAAEIPGLRRAMEGRGGLRARLLSPGVLRPGDPIRRPT